jgi:hypothetical protein
MKDTQQRSNRVIERSRVSVLLRSTTLWERADVCSGLFFDAAMDIIPIAGGT